MVRRDRRLGCAFWKDLRSYELITADGETARIVDGIVDDAGWNVVSFSVTMGSGLDRAARVSVPAWTCDHADWRLKAVHTRLTSRQLEGRGEQSAERKRRVRGRSVSLGDVEGLTVRATDQEIGKVVDCLLLEHGWVIEHLVVDSGAWLESEKLLLPIGWLEKVDWADRSILVDRSSQRVRDEGPVYDPAAPIKRGARPPGPGPYGK